MKKHIDKASGFTVVATLILFVIALFAKGFTHDLLLEAGVFLVSVKLVIAGYKNKEANQELLFRLEEINAKLDQFADLKTTDDQSTRQGKGPLLHS